MGQELQISHRHYFFLFFSYYSIFRVMAKGKQQAGQKAKNTGGGMFILILIIFF
jgi:hypothetical protein